MGVMNLLPWGGPVARASAVLGMDPNELWHIMLPVQILGIATTIGIAALAAMREVKYFGAGKITAAHEDTVEEIKEKNENENLKRPKLLFFNFALTAGVLALLLIDVFPTYFVFMIGCCFALVVNYPDPKEQKNRIKAHAPAALDVSAVMLSAGIMVGIIDKSGMLEAMTKPLLAIIPTVLASHLHILLGTVALPLGTMLGTDPYFYGLMPLAIEVGKNFQIPALTMAVAMMIGKNLALFISPLVPATFLGIGLAEIELKDHLKYSFGWLWATGMIMLAFSVVIGMIAL
jgi:CitMHS family citrate-Mg2+:H+ or citrate-Ca2+:H+ symporter